MASDPSTAIVWFRRDLRLADHRALARALDEYREVVPLFAWDPLLISRSGANRLHFLSGCVERLSDSLHGRLVVRTGDPAEVVPEVAASVGADAVFTTADFGPYGRRRDDAVQAALTAAERRVQWRAEDTLYAVPPATLTTGSGGPFQVFSPFHRAWRAHGWEDAQATPSASALGRISDGGLRSDRGPDLPEPTGELPDPGEDAAHRRLDKFLDGQADRYKSERNRPDLDSTSRLSAYLRFGCVHPRQILARLEPGSAGHDRFESELCWREFYADVLWHRPDASRVSYRQEWRDFQVDRGQTADRRFEAWAEGRTGYPLIDAGMRQLKAEGWMHNRVRMAVASFLVKDLHVDWTRGARWFMQHLVDGDLASNQLNWQWVAGCGTDPAPYFRVFNPVTQSKKFDPDGDYIRRWVPELGGLSGGDLHEPWKVDRTLFGSLDYPDPIVDHGQERREALSRYSHVTGRR